MSEKDSEMEKMEQVELGNGGTDGAGEGAGATVVEGKDGEKGEAGITASSSGSFDEEDEKEGKESSPSSPKSSSVASKDVAPAGYDEPIVQADPHPGKAIPTPTTSPLKDLYEAAFSDQPMDRSSSSQSLATSSHPVSRTASVIDLTPVVRSTPQKSTYKVSSSEAAKRASKDSVESMEPVALDDVPLDGDAFVPLNGGAAGEDKTKSSQTLASPPATSKSSYFGSLGFFSSTSPVSLASPSSSIPKPPDISRSSSASSSTNPQASLGDKVRQTSSSWRSGITSLLSAPSKSPSQPPTELPSTSPGVYTPRSLARPPMDRNVSSSTAFLLNQVTTTADERRRSLEGVKGLKEGFEQKRMRAEMEMAARDTRQNGQAREELLMEAEEFGEGDGEDEEVEGGKVQVQVVKDDGVVEGVDWQFWGAVMGDYEDVARSRAQDLSRAIQQGIPAVIRGTMWQLMSSSKSALLEQKYSSLLKLRSPHEKNIQKDLARTLSHSYFQEAGGVGQENLFNVVKAYSLFDQEVGYTQGIAFCVAPLLLLMPEEEAFCVLVRLMESYDLRSHFLPEMPGLQLRLYQFDRLLEEILPVLHLHFVRTGIKCSMYASQWFMTMFSYRFPLSLVFRIYDIVFAEGIEAIFRFSLALLIANEEQLLALDFEGILKFLQTNLFERYKLSNEEGKGEGQAIAQADEDQWDANAFVSDAYTARITPFMLDSYAGEYQEQLRVQNAHRVEMDVLRNANRNLSAQVKSLESALASMNNEHVDLVRQLVNSRIEKEEVENQLIETKLKLAELSHAHDYESSSSNRASNASSLRR